MPAHRFGVAVLAATVLLVASATLAFATASRPAGPDASSAAASSQFVVECTWSHRAADDPIVHPGHAGASHLHDFFGSTETDATSTAASLLGTPSTCQTLADTAAYWTPTLYAGTDAVEPGRLFAYYRRADGVAPDAVASLPFGLVMIAGDPGATGPQPTDVAAWHCDASPSGASAPPTCPRTAPLTLRITFPTCWDGRRLDSDDHRAHTTYAIDGRCPATHPVVLPELVLDVAYAYWGPPRDLTLASGSTDTAHADFLNAWEPDRLDTLVDDCLRHGRGCGIAPSRTG